MVSLGQIFLKGVCPNTLKQCNSPKSWGLVTNSVKCALWTWYREPWSSVFSVFVFFSHSGDLVRRCGILRSPTRLDHEVIWDSQHMNGMVFGIQSKNLLLLLLLFWYALLAIAASLYHVWLWLEWNARIFQNLRTSEGCLLCPYYVDFWYLRACLNSCRRTKSCVKNQPLCAPWNLSLSFLFLVTSLSFLLHSCFGALSVSGAVVLRALAYFCCFVFCRLPFAL